MRSVQLLFIAIAFGFITQSHAVPQNERVAFCEDQSQSKFPSRYEMQKAYNQCMENADKLIQAYEQDKVRRVEQDRIKREELARKLKERGAPVKQKQPESTDAGSTQEVSESYIGRVRARIKPNIIFNSIVEGNPAAEVEVRCSDDGTITSRRLVTSSGNAEWDNAVLRAIDKTEILPRDVSGKVPSPLLVKFRLRD